MEWLTKKWKEILTVAAIATAVYLGQGWIAEASEYKAKVDKIETAVQDISQIAKAMQRPTYSLEQELFLRGYDSVKVKFWMSLPQLYAPTDDTGKPYDDIIFVNGQDYPDIGLLMKYKEGVRVVLDTLWDFRIHKE